MKCAHGDAPYRYRECIAGNLTPVALNGLSVNAMWLIDLDGNIVWWTQLDLESVRPLRLDVSDHKAVPALGLS